MLTPIHAKILRELLSLPTAPFAEHFVVDYIERFCSRRKTVKLTTDSAGNLLLRVKRGSRRIARPVCITAHLDHPGFVVDRMTSKDVLKAWWRGGVPPEYFAGSKVRFHVDGGWTKGRIRSAKVVRDKGRSRVDHVAIEVKREVPSGSIGMWDFPDPIVRGHRIHARACDDLAGAAAILCCIEQLVRSGLSCDAYFLFTRAEEVGFVGAIAAAKLKTVPKKCFVVCMETSSQRPHARMGDGPILRVGDRTTTFTHTTTAYCRRIAEDLESTDKRFRFQRKLMDGGTCESSAFCALGYEATGLCIALGNYHNVNAQRKKLGAEYVDLRDFQNVVKWFVELARSPRPYTGSDKHLRSQLDDLQKTYAALLKASVSRPR